MTQYFLPSGTGPIAGEKFLASSPDEVLWGWLPNAVTAPVLSVGSGTTVTIDTVSHEGILADQGRDPDAYLAQFGVAASGVLPDVRDIAASGIVNGLEDGPHVVTGPVRVAGAKPGDLLKVDVLDLALRVPYGFVSSRHGFGALPGEFPEFPDSEPTRDIDGMVNAGTVSYYSWVGQRAGRLTGNFDAGGGRTVEFGLDPFLGLMGVAPATEALVPSVPPGDHGGNIDIKHTGVGSTLYLPIQVAGGLFYTGDPHYAQGNGEVALTALEASLRATVRLTVLSGTDATAAIGALNTPFVETATHWIPTGMDEDLNEAMRKATRNAIAFLNTRFGVPRAAAMAYLSAAGDFEVSQVVDAVKGVHCLIAKRDWVAWV
jgi:acetamidase/formamidase